MFLVIVQKQQQYVMGHTSFWAVSSKARITTDEQALWRVFRDPVVQISKKNTSLNLKNLNWGDTREFMGFNSTSTTVLKPIYISLENCYTTTY